MFGPSFFLARRYLTVGHRQNFLYIATRLTLLGIAVASCALTLSLMITSGFENHIQKNLQSLASDIIILPNKKALDKGFIHSLCLDQKMRILQAVCPVMVNQLILERTNGRYQTINFYGVTAETFSQVSGIALKLTPNAKNFIVPTMLKDNTVIMGEKLAKSLGIKLGDTFFALIPIPKNQKISLQKKMLILGATMHTGFDEYDQSLIIGSHDLYTKLFGQGKEKTSNYDLVMIKAGEKISKTPYTINKWRYWLEQLAPYFPLQLVDQTLVAAARLKAYYPNHSVLHWKELSPNLLASLKLEKFAINLVILLILLVGLIGMVSLIFLNIQAKRRDIAILLTLGMSRKQIKTIFVLMGLTIGILGTIIGESLAFAIGYLLKNKNLITLPDVYYFEQLPVNLDPKILFFVFVLTNLVIYLACKLPAAIVDQLNIASVLRN